jgi:ElaB/YqjD/DUF883 family membrane-anchored ribosome-binding protein
MADRNESSLGMIGGEGAARRVHSTANAGGEPEGSVVAEFVDAARSAAESLLQEQKHQVAERVSGVAGALRSAGESLDRSQNQVIARYIQQAAEQVEGLSRTLRNRRWSELVADTEDLARRQPTLFVLGAVATGFVLGRLLWTSSRRSDAPGAPSRAAATRAVTAAVSSGSGSGISAGMAETAAYGAGSSGAMGPR